jgi:hypothetical protein
MIISRRELARTKVTEIQNGYSAFAESQELADLIKKELQKLNIPINEDVTEVGSWFFPDKKI